MFLLIEKSLRRSFLIFVLVCSIEITESKRALFTPASLHFFAISIATLDMSSALIPASIAGLSSPSLSFSLWSPIKVIFFVFLGIIVFSAAKTSATEGSSDL